MATSIFFFSFASLLLLLPTLVALPFQARLDELEAAPAPAASRNQLDWQWQRTGFHFQPSQNWMNDPNGPFFYNGVYHFFYQYNPFAAVWGNITWGHAVSTDMVRWQYVRDLALVPDKWYDSQGVWSGSATLVNGEPVLLYTGSSNTSGQVQNKAVPKNLSDPLLREWVKSDDVNPVAVAPQGINVSDFRDPTTAWIGHDGLWRMAVGSKHRSNNTGIIIQYSSKDFTRWELLDDILHQVEGTGMWECPDFYPVPEAGKRGSENYLQDLKANTTRGMKFVVKASLDEKRWDTYVVGEYDPVSEKFKATVKELDIGLPPALRYDYGIYYASKTFYDPVKKRRILFGWISEADRPASDIQKGWASVQALPRHVWLDESQHALRQWPIEEVNSLRSKEDVVIEKNVLLKSGKVQLVNASQGSQLDIEAVFEVPVVDLHSSSDSFQNSEVEGIPTNTLMYCNGTFPTAEQIVGPFGLHVLASGDLQERTSVFFKLFKFKSGWKSLVCNDLTSSSLASDSTKGVYGSTVRITKTERKSLALRVLVDHSIVETFAQGGKTCIAARSYPLLGGDDNAAHLFLFNNGSVPIKVKHLSVWTMNKVNFTTV